jgi:hypothetical protein
VPQIDDRTQRFRSRIRATLPRRAEVPKALAVAVDARGLSTRNIEALFADETGTSLLSRSAVSQIRKRLWAEYEEFAGRNLSAFDVVSLFGEGIAERLHLGQPREAADARLLRDDIWIDWQGNLECATERGPCGRAGAGSSAEGAPVRDTSEAK